MTSRNLNSGVMINIVFEPCVATLIFVHVSASFSTKYCLIKFRSYFPELNPSTGTWVHQSWIFCCCFFGSMSTSTGRYWVFTAALNWETRLCSSFINLSIKTFESHLQRCVGCWFSVSPTETKIGTCTFSNVMSFAALYILAFQDKPQSRTQ